MEPRIAKREAHAEHVIVDLEELRTDLRDLRQAVDPHFHVLRGAIIGVAGLIAKGFHWF